MTRLHLLSFLLSLPLLLGNYAAGETPDEHNHRMAWWREARFGMFIHWGVYSIPAKGEWYMNNEKVPVKEYENYPPQFNPVQFNAREWVNLAVSAGMKYIVITTKHHDGFCMWDSKVTQYDIIDATPFGRDPLKELAQACKDAGITLCFYHSILDWHHPDANKERFPKYREEYLKPELKELLTNYGTIGVVWFDGDWIPEWTEAEGKDLYGYVRSLQPSTIVNNRVGKGRLGMEGMNDDPYAAGDFGTPEQEIPATGIPGVDWESCMTMNDHWGFCASDSNWKNSVTLVRNLVDIASKGGNYLLNVGPTSLGTIPQESQVRLHQIGAWMAANGKSIYGTTASPLISTPWGRCTMKSIPQGMTTLFLHVFDWPRDGQLLVTGLGTRPVGATLLTARNAALPCSVRGDTLAISVPAQCPDSIDAVVTVQFAEEPVTYSPPRIASTTPVFFDKAILRITSKLEIRYTTDGSEPTIRSERYVEPLTVQKSSVVKARAFYGGKAVSTVSSLTVTKMPPIPAVTPEHTSPGLRYDYYEGSWDKVPTFGGLTSASAGIADSVTLAFRKRDENYGVRFVGYYNAPETGVYRFTIASDDGSRLAIQNQVLIDNDGLHGTLEKDGYCVLAKGLHPIEVGYFNRTGDGTLSVSVAVGNGPLVPLPAAVLSSDAR